MESKKVLLCVELLDFAVCFRVHGAGNIMSRRQERSHGNQATMIHEIIIFVAVISLKMRDLALHLVALFTV